MPRTGRVPWLSTSFAATATNPSCSRPACATGCPRPLAWFILDIVEKCREVDLTPFYRQHRADGHGHPSTTPDPNGHAPVRLRDRGSLQPADRAALPRGPRLSG